MNTDLVRVEEMAVIDLNWDMVLLWERGRDSSVGEISGGLRKTNFGEDASAMACLKLYGCS